MAVDLEILNSLNDIFYVGDFSIQDEERPVQMMFQEDMFKLAYVNEVQVQVLVLPYKGKELSLVVLLPDDGVELSKVGQEKL
jgi:serine protease inhibitor